MLGTVPSEIGAGCLGGGKFWEPKRTALCPWEQPQHRNKMWAKDESFKSSSQLPLNGAERSADALVLLPRCPALPALQHPSPPKQACHPVLCGSGDLNPSLGSSGAQLLPLKLPERVLSRKHINLPPTSCSHSYGPGTWLLNLVSALGNVPSADRNQSSFHQCPCRCKG